MSNQDVAALIQNAESAHDVIVHETIKQRFKFQRVEEIAFHPEDDRWLVEGIIPMQGVVIAYGPTQTYKTFVMLDMITSVAIGAKSWGRFSIENLNFGKCVYVAAEGAGGIKKRLAGIKAHRDNRLANLILLADRPILGVTKGGDTTALISEMKTFGTISMVAIDTLAQVLGGGDENGSGMQATLAAATDISSELNCAVVLIHHPGHHGKDPRGHSSAMGNADTLLQFEDDGLLRSKVTVRKQKDEESGKTFCVDLKLQQLGRTKAGLLTTTLVVEKIADAPVKNHAQQKRLTPAQTDLMSAYRQAFSGKRETITLSESTNQVEAVGLENLRSVFYSRNSHKSANTRGKAFVRAIDELIRRGLLCSAEYQAEPYIYSRKEEFSSSSGQDRDIRDTLKGGVTLVPPSPVTDLDNVTQCHSVTALAEP